MRKRKRHEKAVVGTGPASASLPDEDRLLRIGSEKFDPENQATRDAMRAFRKYEKELVGQPRTK